MASRWYAGGEAAVLGIAIAFGPPKFSEKMTHFTWWGVASLLVFDVTLVLGWARLHAAWHFISATIACSVLLGVLSLSLLRCRLLVDAVAEFGPSWYILGNTAIHYFPVTRIFLEPVPTVTYDSRWHQYLAVGTILLAYLHTTAASSTYGCNVPEFAVVLSATAGVLLATLFENGLFWWHRYAARAPVR